MYWEAISIMVSWNYYVVDLMYVELLPQLTSLYTHSYTHIRNRFDVVKSESQCHLSRTEDSDYDDLRVEFGWC